MRVIAGSAKGTRLYGPAGEKLRPVLDRVKESVFDILADRVAGARVLDLFAGVGSFGIEALSRGALHADFFEAHRPAASSIRANLERTGLSGRANVKVARLPKGLKSVEGGYSLIFTDPPFRIDNRLLEGTFRRIHSGRLLEEGGLLLYRHSPHDWYEPPNDKWSRVDRRDYGDSIVSFYCWRCVKEDGR